MAGEIKKCFGVNGINGINGICRELSYEYKRPLTFLDCIENQLEAKFDEETLENCTTEPDYELINEIMSVFKEVGFKLAEDCDINIIRAEFCSNDKYKAVCDEIFEE